LGVDDLLVAGNSVAEITEVRERMNQRFILSDQGKSEYYLGVEILSLDENTLLLHQTAYAKKMYRCRIFLEKHRIFLKNLTPNIKTENGKPQTLNPKL
jgi:hypothetical protein